MTNTSECENTDRAVGQKKMAMLFFVQGGAGDVLAHTPMIRYYRHLFPDDELVVMSTYSHLFENNPYVDRILPLKDPEDVYSQYKGRIRFWKKHFVYDAIYDIPGLESKSLPEFICRVYDAEYDGEPLDYFASERELKIAKTFLSQFKKPVILLHLVGSIPSEGVQPQKVHNHKDLRFQDLTQVIERYKEKYDFVQIGLHGEPLITGAYKGFGMPMREACALIPQCKTFIFIESFFAHAANAFRKQGIVVFNNTNPKFFGYSSNKNVSYSGGCADWPCNRPIGALMDVLPGYLDPLTRNRPLWSCPDQRCAVTPPEMIAEALESILMAKEGPMVVSAAPAVSLKEARNG